MPLRSHGEPAPHPVVESLRGFFEPCEPIGEPEAMERAIRRAFGRGDGVFVRASSDGTLLRPSLEMAARFDACLDHRPESR